MRHCVTRPEPIYYSFKFTCYSFENFSNFIPVKISYYSLVMLQKALYSCVVGSGSSHA